MYLYGIFDLNCLLQEDESGVISVCKVDASEICCRGEGGESAAEATRQQRSWYPITVAHF